MALRPAWHSLWKRVQVRKFSTAAAMLLAVLTLPPVAIASEIDCRKAKSPVDLLICAEHNDSLRSLHASLAATVSKKLKSLDRISARVLIREQRQWLANREVASGCFNDFIGSEYAQSQCMEAHYDARIDVLSYKPSALIYSAEDRLCVPLHREVEEYSNRIRPARGAFHYAFPEILERAGISKVKWIGTDSPPDGRAILGLETFLFEADVFGDRTPQFVYMRFQAHGRFLDFHVYPIILKAGTSYRETTINIRPGYDVVWVDPEIIEVETSFRAHYVTLPKNYPIIYGDDLDKIRFPLGKMPSEDLSRWILSGQHFIQFEPEQTAFTFDGRAYFQAGMLERSRIYRVAKGGIVEIVCVWTEERAPQ